jgi:hypothetical protein
MFSVKRLGIMALPAVTLAGSFAMTSAADARGGGGFRGGGFHGGGFHGGGGYRGGGFYGGRGYGVGAGLATGLAIGAIGAGYYGYPYAGYGYGAYGAGYGDCFLRRRIVIDRFGYRHVRHVRVCY